MKCGRIGITLAALGLGVVAGGFFSSLPKAVATALQQGEKLCATDAKLAEAESLYKANNVRSATEALARAQAAVTKLADVQELSAKLDPLKKRLANLHDLMELDGAKVSPIPASLAVSDNSMPDKPTTKPTTKTTPVPKPVVAKTPIGKPAQPAWPASSLPYLENQFWRARSTSWKQVADVLVEKCGGGAAVSNSRPVRHTVISPDARLRRMASSPPWQKVRRVVLST